MNIRHLEMPDGSLKLQSNISPAGHYPEWIDVPIAKVKSGKSRRETIRTWVNVHGDNFLRYCFYPTKEEADSENNETRLECIELLEIPKGSKVISAVDLGMAIHEHFTTTASEREAFAKQLGFGDQDE